MATKTRFLQLQKNAVDFIGKGQSVLNNNFDAIDQAHIRTQNEITKIYNTLGDARYITIVEDDDQQYNEFIVIDDEIQGFRTVDAAKYSTKFEIAGDGEEYDVSVQNIEITSLEDKGLRAVKYAETTKDGAIAFIDIYDCRAWYVAEKHEAVTLPSGIAADSNPIYLNAEKGDIIVKYSKVDENGNKRPYFTKIDQVLGGIFVPDIYSPNTSAFYFDKALMFGTKPRIKIPAPNFEVYAETSDTICQWKNSQWYDIGLNAVDPEFTDVVLKTINNDGDEVPYDEETFFPSVKVEIFRIEDYKAIPVIVDYDIIYKNHAWTCELHFDPFYLEEGEYYLRRFTFNNAYPTAYPTTYWTVTFNGDYYEVYGGNSGGLINNLIIENGNQNVAINVTYPYIRVHPMYGRFDEIPSATGSLELISGSSKTDDFIYKINGDGVIYALGDD